MLLLQDANDRGWFRTEPSRTKGKPDMSIILPTALELADGLGYLHEQDILHGDLSPGNVLLADEPGAPHGFTVKVNLQPTESLRHILQWTGRKKDTGCTVYISNCEVRFECRLLTLG